MDEKHSGKILEILAPLSRLLNRVPQKATKEATLHARIVALVVDFCSLKPAEIGQWLEDHGQTYEEVLNHLAAPIGRPHLASRSKLRGAPHLKARPSPPTIAKLLSPSGAKVGLSTQISHLQYIAVCCADYRYPWADEEERAVVLPVLVRSIFRNVMNAAFDDYEERSNGSDPDDDIDLEKARNTFSIRHSDGWRNINTELERLKTLMVMNPLEARQLSAAFLLGDRPSLLTALGASASRSATEIAFSEVGNIKGPSGIWIRGAVGSGKTTVLYQLSIAAARKQWQVYFLDGLTFARLQTDLFLSQIKQRLSSRQTAILLDNAEFLSAETLLHLSNLFLPDGPIDTSMQCALILATQTERLSTNQLGILRKFSAAYRYQNRELKRDKALYADRLDYVGYPSDIVSLTSLIHGSGLASRLSLSEIKSELAQRFNNRSSSLLMSSLVSVIERKEMRARISDSIQSLTTENTFSMVPGLNMHPGPVPVTLGVIALCRYRYTGLSHRKFFCDEHLISACIERFFGVDTTTGIIVSKRIIEILWDEVFFDVEYMSVSPTDPWRFVIPGTSERQYGRPEIPVVDVGGLVDTRHPDVTEAIYRALFRPAPGGAPAALDEVQLSTIVGEAARKCSLSTKVRSYEHTRTFLTLGRSFDSRIRDQYYEHFQEWASTPLTPGHRAANLAARFCFEASKAYIDSVFEMEIFKTAEANRRERLIDLAGELLALAETHSRASPRKADLRWLRTDIAAQRIRLLQLGELGDATAEALVGFFDDSQRIMNPGNLTAISSVIRNVGREALAGTNILTSFESDCCSVGLSKMLEGPFYMELGRYVRDVRPLSNTIALMDPEVPREQNAQVLCFFRQALLGLSVADGWYIELFLFCTEREILPIGAFQGEQLDQEATTLRNILRTGITQFEDSVKLLSQLAKLEIAEARKYVESGDLSSASEILGDFDHAARFTIRWLARTLVEIQAEKLPVSIARDFMPILDDLLELELLFGKIEAVIDNRLERYSIRWWIAVFLGGGQEGRISLSSPIRENINPAVSSRRLYDLAFALWTKGKELGDSERQESIGRESAAFLSIAIPDFRTKDELRNRLRGYALALDIAMRCNNESILPETDWFSIEVIRQELTVALELALSTLVADRDRELIHSAASVLGDVRISAEIEQMSRAKSSTSEDQLGT